VRERYHEVDPRTLAARRGNLPLVWDLQQLRTQPSAELQSERTQEGLDGFIRTMREDGMRSGLMFAMAIPGTRLHAFMSFTGQRRSRDWISSTTLEQALSIGISVHTIASQQLMSAARARTAEGLTSFERELLLGIAEGASDKEIGRRLDTSAHNVDYHLRKLRKRFGVANRTELTYLTSKLELI
jgi:DNA-binding CsgD family transcriptional regulator